VLCATLNDLKSFVKRIGEGLNDVKFSVPLPAGHGSVGDVIEVELRDANFELAM
jgi:hypothetical protein